MLMKNMKCYMQTFENMIEIKNVKNARFMNLRLILILEVKRK